MEIVEKKYLKLNDVRAYKIAFSLSNYVWDVVMKWDWFTKKDKIKFYRYSYGSAKECLDWNEKAKTRNLLSEEDYKHILNELQLLPREINYQIKLTKEKLA